MTANSFDQVAFETHAHACTFPTDTDGRPDQIAAVAYEVRGLATTSRPSGTLPGLDDTLETLGWQTATEMNGAVRPLPRRTPGRPWPTSPTGSAWPAPVASS
ncbi:hypothetical protein ABZ759_32835 [Streptomyces sp. NPDC047860]|uniref:hypothetical protein n=1 Tax=Streptomyces sp. NPDC047860 TaxID=3155743 RepID=UPI0033CF792D